MDNRKKILVDFLSDLITQIESDDMELEAQIRIENFYKSFKRCDKTEQGRNEDENTDDEDDMDTKDFIRFLILGWYVYSLIKTTKIEPTETTNECIIQPVTDNTRS